MLSHLKVKFCCGKISESNSSSSMSGPKGRKGTTSSDQYQRNSIPDLKVNGLEYVHSIQEICSPRKTGDDCRLVKYCIYKKCLMLNILSAIDQLTLQILRVYHQYLVGC